MGTRNITSSVDEELLKRLKVLAAQRDTSVSGLVSEVVRHLVGETEDHDAVWRAEEQAMDAGLLHVGPRRWTRDDLHARTR